MYVINVLGLGWWILDCIYTIKFVRLQEEHIFLCNRSSGNDSWCVIKSAYVRDCADLQGWNWNAHLAADTMSSIVYCSIWFIWRIDANGINIVYYVNFYGKGEHAFHTTMSWAYFVRWHCTQYLYGPLNPCLQVEVHTYLMIKQNKKNILTCTLLCVH